MAKRKRQSKSYPKTGADLLEAFLELSREDQKRFTKLTSADEISDPSAWLEIQLRRQAEKKSRR